MLILTLHWINMAANNLRIIYQNLADSATITASSTAGITSPTNLAKDTKSLIWRSALSGASVVKANLVVNFTSAIVGGVMLPFCNLSPTATIRVRGYTGALPTMGGSVDVPTVSTTGTEIFDTGDVIAAPYQVLGLWDWGAIPLGVNSYSYGGGTYGRVWLPTQKACTSLLIQISDPSSTDKYIELSRLVIGSYWSPKFNTSFGLSSTFKDLSTHERSVSGDLLTVRGIRYRSMQFDLQWLTPEDRLQFTRILKGNGISNSLAISLFPDSSEDWDKEQSHQIYGKLSQLSDIQHPMFGIYSTTVDIEEF